MTKYITLAAILLLNVVNLFGADKRDLNVKNPKAKVQSSYGAISVKKWADDKKSAFTFSFDDSFESQYTYAVPILDKYGMKATFFVIAGAVTNGPPEDWRYGYWWQFRDMAAEGHEIAAHTMTHPDLTKLPVGNIYTPNTLTYELYQSQQIIEQKIPGYKCVSLAYPYCTYDSTVENVASNYFISARTCGAYAEPSNINGLNWYDVVSITPVYSLPRNSVDDDQLAFDTYTYNVQTQSINSGDWAVFFTHEVVPDSVIAAGGDTTMYYPTSTYWLDELCQWVKQKSDSGLVWEATYGNVARYIKERQDFTYNIISSSTNQIEISTTCGLDTSIYNYPLTVDITVPQAWKEITITQGDSIETCSSFFNGSDYVVRAHVIPGGDNVIITSGGSYTLSGQIYYDNSFNSPLPNVKIILSSSEGTDSTMTDSSGDYSFSKLIPGNYEISLSSDAPVSGINSTDAMIIAKYFLKQENFDSLQTEAADVNNDNKINSTDALLVCKRFVRLVSSFNRPNWIFLGSLDITISNSNVTKNFEGIETGDVNKSYLPPNPDITSSSYPQSNRPMH